MPVNNVFKARADLAFAHRFEGQEAAADDCVIDLYAFRFEGQRIKQSWLRAGLGFNAQVTKQSKVGVMLYGSIRGQSPTYWGSLDYRWAF